MGKLTCVISTMKLINLYPPITLHNLYREKKCLKQKPRRNIYLKENAQPTMENTMYQGWKVKYLTL